MTAPGNTDVGGESREVRRICNRLIQQSFSYIASCLISKAKPSAENPLLKSSLCELCQAVPFYNLPRLKRSSEHGELDFYTECMITDRLRGASYPSIAGHTRHPPGFKHVDGLDELSKSAQKCELCALIDVCVGQFIPCALEYTSDVDDPDKKPFGLPETFRLWLARRDHDAPGFVIYTDSNKDNDVLFVGEVSFLAHEDNFALRQKFPGRLIQNDPDHAKSLNRVFEWLDTCLKTHTACRFADVALPTRVLDLQSPCVDNMVVVKDTAGRRGEYAALSYCWGKTGNLKSTTATIEEHRRGIKVTSLPKTIQDAVVIAQHLGLRYLWVDALCIIQDDVKDWEREAQQMARIYANAYLSISALGAKDTSQGCLAPRQISQKVVPLDYDDENNTRHRVFATIVTQQEMGTKRRDLGGYPASERGWILQERILAQRTLHLGNDQMYFECGWGFQSEDGYAEPRDSQPSSLKHDSEFFDGDMAGSLFAGFEGWARLVKIYGMRYLTNDSDKLPAFSGIAKRYEALLDDIYVAGLWKGRLIDDLHWVAEFWRTPPDYRAPSWSWMSIDGPISIQDMNAQKAGRQCANVLEYHLELKG
ncbi:hypothetical protein PT974_10732 [Cladobotryum mycophilum]|uniref:Heterokaryon incompatibility domain-containing protein n=1 Tax=Cladobotryum mycophilum TaxID=491253 RepID=A0ABR0SAR2_9HYPO